MLIKQKPSMCVCALCLLIVVDIFDHLIYVHYDWHIRMHVRECGCEIFLTSQVSFLSPNQQCYSVEGVQHMTSLPLKHGINYL